MIEELPISRGDVGEAVSDVQRRLIALGQDTGPDGDKGAYGLGTDEAVERFQQARGLDIDGVCGAQTWSALVEAGYQLGDRLIYRRSPMLRGDDVYDLQRQLCALGFDAGRVDGIFGPDTEGALKDFQRNSAITTDGVCGRDALSTLRRLGDRTHGEASGALVRQAEQLRDVGPSLAGRRIALGERGGLGALSHALQRVLVDRGAHILVLHDPDESSQAKAANDYAADAFVALELDEAATCSVAYFGVPGYESLGGRRLGELILEQIPPVLAIPAGSLQGMRRPLLRETRMPAVTCRFGPPAEVVKRTATLAAAFGSALDAWMEDPLP
jgi:N-acetylmuramoyl-L-alanine amidase